MCGCSLQLAQLGMNFPTSPECWVGRMVDAKWPFFGHCEYTAAGWSFRSCAVQSTPGTKRRNIHGTCALAGSMWQPGPQLWPQLPTWSKRVQVPWHLHSRLQLCCWYWFKFASGLHATCEPRGKPARSLCACGCALACACVSSPSGPSGLGIREQQGLLGSLPCPSGRCYHRISQTGKRKLLSGWSSSTSNLSVVSQSKMFWWQPMPGFALNCPWGSIGFLQLPLLWGGSSLYWDKGDN